MKRSPLALWLLVILLIAATSAPGQVTPRCAVCGHVVIDNYYEIDGRYYHADHFLCETCKKPIGEQSYVTVEGRNYHKFCYQKRVAMVCSVCNRAIEEDGRQDYWGNFYHLTHFDEKPQCDFCGRLIFGGYVAGSRRFPDERSLCGLCAPTSVTRVPQAESLMVRVAGDLAQDGVKVNVKGLLLLLADRPKMQRISATAEKHVHGFTDYASFGDELDRPEFEGANICLLVGMPETQMMATIAHELMHVWQSKRNPLMDNDPLREGSAVYAEYLLMERLGSKEAQFIIHRLMADDDPAYGDGYRRVKKYADEHGVDALLKQLARERPDIPVEK